MKEKMLFFSILSLLLGLNIYFVLTNILGLIFLSGAAVLSALFFLYGILKDKGRESRQKRGWDRPFWKKVLKKK